MTVVQYDVSPNRLEGSLCDTSVERLLSACHRHLVTGALEIRAAGVVGVVELRAGAVDRVEFGEARGDRALDLLRKLADGDYQLTQRLPDLGGALAGSTAVVTDGSLSMIAVMRHCEDHALSCTIRVERGRDRGEIRYRAGDLVQARTGALDDADALVAMKAWTDARIEVSAPPLNLDIEGWPQLRPRSEPFALGAPPTARPPSPRFATGTGGLPKVPEPAALSSGTPAAPLQAKADRAAKRTERRDAKRARREPLKPRRDLAPAAPANAATAAPAAKPAPRALPPMIPPLARSLAEPPVPPSRRRASSPSACTPTPTPPTRAGTEPAVLPDEELTPIPPPLAARTPSRSRPAIVAERQRAAALTYRSKRPIADLASRPQGGRIRSVRRSMSTVFGRRRDWAPFVLFAIALGVATGIALSIMASLV